MRDRVLISCIHVLDRMETVAPMLEDHGIEWDLADVDGQQLSADELLPLVGRYDGVLAGDDEFTADVFGRAKRLRVIAKWGIGIDAIDVVAAQERGILVLNTPGMFGHEIADYALAFVLMLFRQQHRADRLVRSGGWPKLRGHSLAGHTLGIVGLGSSGRELARRGAVMGMDVAGTDVVRPEDAVLDGIGCRFVADVDELFSQAHVVSLHTPLTPLTRHLVDAERLARMRPGSLLVNTARGGLVDEGALIEALAQGHLGGAALDVYAEEPLPRDHPLVSLENVVLGSHNASNTWEAVDRTTVRAVDQLIDGLERTR